jgi:hypothetical protein
VILDSSHALNLVVDHAGAPGDYLYRSFVASPGNYAMWGLFRVGPPAADVLVLTTYQRTASPGGALSGYVTPDLRTGRYATEVRLVGRPDRAPVDQRTGAFRFALANAPVTVTVQSANGGQASAALPPIARPLLAAALPRVASRIAPAPAIASAPGGTGATHVEQLQTRAAKFRARSVDQPPAAQ